MKLLLVAMHKKKKLYPKMTDFAEENFRRFLLKIKPLPSIIGCEPIRRFKNCFTKIYHPCGKGYFAAIGTLGIFIFYQNLQR